MKRRHGIAGLLVLACLTGCYRSAVRGEVVDLNGEQLPGVAVSVEGTSFQDVTNGVGRYSVRYMPGTVRLHFRKTGYTPAVLELQAEGPWPVDAKPVTLWHVPHNRGVYFFRNNRYQPTEPVEPRRFRGGLYGTEDWPKEAITNDPRPRLIVYHLPLEGISLVRMKFIEAMPEDPAAEQAVEIWSPDVTVPVAPVPLDEPEHLLIDIRYDGDLAPGTYAVHWGALAGSREPVPSIYLFSVESDAPVVAPEEEEEEKAEEQGEKKTEGQ